MSLFLYRPCFQQHTEVYSMCIKLHFKRILQESSVIKTTLQLRLFLVKKYILQYKKYNGAKKVVIWWRGMTQNLFFLIRSMKEVEPTHLSLSCFPAIFVGTKASSSSPLPSCFEVPIPQHDTVPVTLVLCIVVIYN